MLIYVNRLNVLITAVEGAGDNIYPEDEAQGFVDYFMTSIYAQDGDELLEKDGGQLMTKNYVKDMGLKDTVKLILDYWDLSEYIDDSVVLNKSLE